MARATSAIALVFVALSAFAGDAPAGSYPLWDGKETTDHYAWRVGLPAKKTLELGAGVTMDMVLIPPGRFMMGSPEPKEPQETIIPGQNLLLAAGGIALLMVLLIVVRAVRTRTRPQFSLRWLMLLTIVLSVSVHGGVRWYQAEQTWREYDAEFARTRRCEPNERPAHAVTITKPFYLGCFEVTQEQYKQVMGKNPSREECRQPLFPVERVSWSNAVDFCKRASKTSGQTVRLPTEAEWEYAARAGTRTVYYSGNKETDLDRVAWYAKQNRKRGWSPYPVGLKKPNAFSLYDMLGNAEEWCQDWYGPYSSESVVDPQGPKEGSLNILRGGSGW